MKNDEHDPLSRRERQIMNILYKLGSGTAAEVQSQLPGEPSYSTVRAQLRILEEKGIVEHDDDGIRYLFRPKVPREKASRSAIRNLLDTFFSGSPEQMVATLLDSESARLSAEELDRLSRLVREAKARRPK
jgi:BlaI family penicillinase repressor